MKTSTLPPLRVSPELRADVEAVLAPGESLDVVMADQVFASRIKLAVRLVEKLEGPEDAKRRAIRCLEEAANLAHTRNVIAHNPWRIWMDFGKAESSKAKAWKDIWGAGQGVGAVRGILPAADYIAKLAAEYEEAKRELMAKIA